MGLCKDKSVTFLKNSGYNVVRHPNAAIHPLDLIGVQKKSPLYLGPLNLLITNPPVALPTVTKGIKAADINGKASSKLKIGIGANVLGAIVGAMGGEIGVDLSYTNARQIEFSYAGVLNDQVVPLEVGSYLRDSEVDADNLILQQYVMGNGTLYLITKTAKSNKITVTYERSDGVAARLDVPVLQDVAGGNVEVDTSSAASGKITFEGDEDLVFAFQAFQVGVVDGVLSLTSVRPGGVFLAVDDPDGDRPVIFDTHGLLEFEDEQV